MADNLSDDSAIQQALAQAKTVDTSSLPGAVVKPYEPTWRDRVASWMLGDQPSFNKEQFVQGLVGSRGLGTTGFSVADVTPVGQVLGGQEALKSGDYRGAAMAMLPMEGGLGHELSSAENAILRRMKYGTSQEGPFYRVHPRPAGEEGSIAGRSGQETWPSSPADAARRGPTPYGTPQLDPITGKTSPLMPSAEANIPLKAANKYVESIGLPPISQPEMPRSSLTKQSAIGRTFNLAAEGSPEYKSAIFDAYGRMMPEVIEQSGAQNYDQLLEAAYRQMAKETADQFEALPLRYSFHRAGEGNYESSGHMVNDVHNNGHLFVYQGGDRHDFLHNVDPETGLNENEKFRAVHDAFGHAILGNTFGPQGEERAWGVHSRMYSPLARLAMTAETRGQNSVVNYTPLNMKTFDQLGQIEMRLVSAIKDGRTDEIEALKRAKTEAMQDWQYAPNKAVLLPPEFLSTEYAGGMPSYIQPLIKPEPGTTLSSTLAHFSRDPNLTMTDPSRYGTGLKGAERDRLYSVPGGVMNRSYFYLGDPNRVTPEPGLGSAKYRAQSGSIYDWNKDPAGLWAISQELNRNPATSTTDPAWINMSQAVNDVERLAKEYGYSGIANTKHRYPMAIMFDPMEVQKAGRATGGRTEHATKSAVDDVDTSYLSNLWRGLQSIPETAYNYLKNTSYSQMGSDALDLGKNVYHDITEHPIENLLGALPVVGSGMAAYDAYKLNDRIKQAYASGNDEDARKLERALALSSLSAIPVFGELSSVGSSAARMAEEAALHGAAEVGSHAIANAIPHDAYQLAQSVASNKIDQALDAAKKRMFSDMNDERKVRPDIGRAEHATKGAVDEPDDFLPQQTLEDPADTILRKMGTPNTFLGGMGDQYPTSSFHQPHLVAAGLSAAQRALLPDRPANLSAIPIKRTGADILAKDPALAANPPVLSERGKPFHELEYTYTPRGNLVPWKEKTPEELYKEGAYLLPAVGDKTAADYIIHSIMANKLSQPTVMEGGFDFQRGLHSLGDNPAAWASRPGAVEGMWTKILNKNIPPDSPVYMTSVNMGAPAGDSSHHMAEALLRQIDPSNLSQKGIDAVNNFLSKKIENWPGIQNPKIVEELLRRNNVGAETALIAEAMDKATPYEAGFPDVGAARFAITNPRMFSADQLASGYSMSKLDLTKPPFMDEDGHPTYPKKLPSVSGYEGGFKYQVPAEIMFSDWASGLPEITKRGIPPLPTEKQQSLMTKMPVQKATQEWLDNLMRHQEEHKKIWGYRKGGRASGNNAIDNALRSAHDGFANGGVTPDADTLVTGLTEQIAGPESGHNNAAYNPASGAFGKYQMLPSTALSLQQKYHPEMGVDDAGNSLSNDQRLRQITLNHQLQTELATNLTRENMKVLQSHGIDTSPGNVYAAHFIGAGAATRVLSADPSTPLASLISPKAIAANPMLANMTAGDFAAFTNRAMSGFKPQNRVENASTKRFPTMRTVQAPGPMPNFAIGTGQASQDTETQFAKASDPVLAALNVAKSTPSSQFEQPAAPQSQQTPPFMQELTKSQMSLPTVDGLSVAQWAKRHAFGDISRVHGRVKYVDGQPRLQFYLA